MGEPEWLKVANDLAARIDAGEMVGWLPSLPNLRQRYGLSQSTVQRALSELALRGVVQYNKGRGYRVVGGGLP